MQGARYLQIDWRNIADGAHGEQRYRQDAMQRAEGDLARNSEPEDEQDHRIERDFGNGIECHQQRLADGARQMMRTEPDADRKAQSIGDDKRVGECGERRQSVLGKARARHQMGEIGECGRRSRQCGVAHHEIQALPDREQDGHDDQRIGYALRCDHCGRTPRRADQRRSQACSAMFMQVANTRSKRISAYILRLLKSL